MLILLLLVIVGPREYSAAHAHQVMVIGAAQGFFLRSAHVFYKIFRALQSETVYIVVRFRMDTSVFGVQG